MVITQGAHRSGVPRVVRDTDSRYSSSRCQTPCTTGPNPSANLGYLFRLAHQRFRAALEAALQDLGLSAQDYVCIGMNRRASHQSHDRDARQASVPALEG